MVYSETVYSETIVADAKASVTRDELVTQIEALQGVVAQIETARA